MQDQKRIAQWIEGILEGLSGRGEKEAFYILRKCGADCCRRSDFYKGASEIQKRFGGKAGHKQIFEAFKKEYSNIDKLFLENGRIVLIFDECTCPIHKIGVKNPTLCLCTTAFTKELFETLFGMEVDVELKQSILRGDNCCRQEVFI